MSFTTKDSFTFNHAAQPDYPQTTPTQNKSNLDARGEELRLSLNAVINKLNSITANDSGADNVLAKEITGLSVNLTGTVSKTAASATLTGTGTLFTTELVVGSYITVPGTSNEIKKVTAIASNTSLTVDSNFANTATGQTAYRANDVWALLKALKTSLDNVVLGQIPDGSLTNAKLATDIKVGSLAALTTTTKTDVVSAINEHIADAIKHITAAERTLWNTNVKRRQLGVRI